MVGKGRGGRDGYNPQPLAGMCFGGTAAGARQKILKLLPGVS